MTRPWPDDPSFSTESYLGAIERGVAGPDEARWARSLAERVDPVGERNRAIREAAALWPDLTVTAGSKRLARELATYAASAWLRERELPQPPPGASELRVLLHRIARLTGGVGTIGDRQILNILQSAK